MPSLKNGTIYSIFASMRFVQHKFRNIFTEKIYNIKECYGKSSCRNFLPNVIDGLDQREASAHNGLMDSLTELFFYYDDKAPYKPLYKTRYMVLCDVLYCSSSIYDTTLRTKQNFKGF